METNRFFIFINRLNSIFFLLVLVLVVGTIVSFFDNIRGTHHRVVEIEAPNGESNNPETLELSDVHRVGGREIQFIVARSTKDGRFSSGGYSYTERNILFLDRKGINPTWLFKSNNNVLVSISQLARKLNKTDRQTQTHYFYYVVATADTNSDGLVSDRDSLKIGISSHDGSNFRYLVKNVVKVINSDYLENENILALLIQVENKILYREYDIDSGLVKTEKFVTKV